MRVDGYGRLVEEDELGLVRDAASDVQAAEQAARELARAELRVVLEADELDRLVDERAALLLVLNIERAEVIDVLAYGQLFEYGDVLGHDADLAFEVVAGGGHLFPEQFDLAFVVGEQLQDTVDSGRLAAAVRPEQAEHFAWLDMEIEMIQSDHFFVALHEVVDIDDMHGSSCCRCDSIVGFPLRPWK